MSRQPWEANSHKMPLNTQRRSGSWDRIRSKLFRWLPFLVGKHHSKADEGLSSEFLRLEFLSNGVKKGDERQHAGNQTMEYKFRRYSGWNFPLSNRMANRSPNPPERENLLVKPALLDP